MPRLIEPEGRTETLVDAINYVLARDDAAGLSLRAIARESRVSTSSMLHHFDSRDRLLNSAAWVTGKARLRAIQRRAPREGIAAFLPAPGDDEDLVTARAWLGWCELWRSEDILERTIAEQRDRELLLLARVLDVRVSEHDLTPLTAMIDGLTIAVCAPQQPLPPARARAHLEAYIARGPWSGSAGPAES